MNVIVSNRQKGIIDNANIDAIKDLNGLFNVDDLINKFKNYFFSKMILDATSVVDFASKEVLQKLVSEIGADRLIILLPSTPEPPEEFKKMLIDLEIYNFSNNIDDVVRFIEKPNTYDNVAKTLTPNNDEYYVDSSIKEGENIDEEEDNISSVEDNASSAEDNVTNLNVMNNDDEFNSNGYFMTNKHSSLGDMMSRFNVYNGDEDNDSYNTGNEIVNEEKEEINNTNDNALSNYNLNDDYNVADSSANSTSRVFLNMDGFDNFEENAIPKSKNIIGFKNVTEHAGSTTLIYMLIRLAQKRNIDVIAIEVNKEEFKLFRNSKMISVKENDISNTLNTLRESLVLVDLNDCADNGFCNDIVYLVEPSTIKLNKLMMVDKLTFDKLKENKVVLNKSMLSNDDIKVLENEAGMRFFFNVNSVNDRIDNLKIQELFDKLINE